MYKTFEKYQYFEMFTSFLVDNEHKVDVCSLQLDYILAFPSH